MQIVNLTFHGIGTIPRLLDAGEMSCWLEAAFFTAVLDRIGACPHVRLTVDDGNDSDADLILPALLERKLRATFFVCAGRLDTPSFLDRERVRRLASAGMTIGSHGCAHVPWRRLEEPQLRDELHQSRSRLEDICGQPITAAACPFGSYDRRVLRAVRRAGYEVVYNSDGGAARAEAWIQPRTTVRRTTSLAELEQLVHGRPSGPRRLLTFLRRQYKRLR